MEFCGRGGKRLRPRLCRAVFEAVRSRGAATLPEGDRSRGAATLPGGGIDGVCEAVECFHKASLIHDDIQDCDEERYGRPTVWKEYGVALAIAAGDWLVAHGYEMIVNSGFANSLAMIKATVQSHIALCEGQGDDLMGEGERSRGAATLPEGWCHTPSPLRGTPPVSGGELRGTRDPTERSRGAATLPEARYLSVCERKTGEGFALAAELGALASGADPAPYRRYGLDFGVLFQVRDDIADGEAPDGADALEGRLARELEASEVARSLGGWFREVRR